MDWQIAVIALANAAMLLSHNCTDFGKVPALPCSLWRCGIVLCWRP